MRIIPKLLSIEDADRLRAEHDPYTIMQQKLSHRDYGGFAQALRRKTPARHTAAMPLILLCASDRTICTLSKEMRKRGTLAELVYCATVAMKYERHSSALGKLAMQYTGKQGALAGFPTEEFNHFYEVYRYAARSARA